MEEEEMARQSQEPEQTSKAVLENIQPLPEIRDLMRAENTQMLQADNQASKGACVNTQSLSLHIEGSGHLTVINPSNCTFNTVKQQVKQGTTEDISSAWKKLLSLIHIGRCRRRG